MSDQAPQFERLPDGRYRVVAHLDSGGMADVFLAEDRKFDRQVAIKVLSPELGVSVGQQRFEREIQISASLEHPHVLTVIDSGEVEGRPFYVMPYIDGGSVRDRLQEEGTLSIDDVIRIVQQTGAALAHAHGRGFVHRDVKPENILLSGGQAVVADFGIARAVEVARGGTRLTRTGLAVGTTLYMSPEQALGEVALDGRSDLYALGCVAYEMLAGSAPYLASSAQGVMVERLKGPPTDLRRRRPEVPLFLERAVCKAIAYDPAHRFTSVAEFLEAISSLTVVDEVRSEGPTITLRADSVTSLDRHTYESFMRGRVHQERFTPEDLTQALRYYHAVLEEAPGFAPAHAAIAVVLGSQLVLGLAPAAENGPRMKQAALRAVRLDPEMAEGHGALAEAYTWFDWSWGEAEQSYRRSLELDPGEAQTRMFYSHYLAAMLRFEEAVVQAERALEIDKRNPFHQILFAGVHLMRRDFESAEAELEKALEVTPNNSLAHWMASSVQALTGRLESARESAETFFRTVGDVAVADVLADGADGAESAFRCAAEVLVERSRAMFVKPELISLLYDRGGELDRAIEWVERGYEQRDHQLAYARVTPYSEALHNDPRYRAVVRRLDFPQV